MYTQSSQREEKIEIELCVSIRVVINLLIYYRGIDNKKKKKKYIIRGVSYKRKTMSSR